MKIKMGKEYVTRRGDPVRIYCVDGGGYYPIHGSYYYAIDNRWIPIEWDILGMPQTYRKPDMALKEKPKTIKRTYWVNVYEESDDIHSSNISYGCTSKEAANEIYADELEKGIRNDDRIACVQVTLSCMEGDGLGDKL